MIEDNAVDPLAAVEGGPQSLKSSCNLHRPKIRSFGNSPVDGCIEHGVTRGVRLPA
jgi:hypothetical protein